MEARRYVKEILDFDRKTVIDRAILDSGFAMAIDQFVAGLAGSLTAATRDPSGLGECEIAPVAVGGSGLIG